jgi:hypothetical protein
MFQKKISKKEKKFHLFIFIFGKVFQVWWARRQAVGADGLPVGLPNLKCFKKEFQKKENKNLKI